MTPKQKTPMKIHLVQIKLTGGELILPLEGSLFTQIQVGAT